MPDERSVQHCHLAGEVGVGMSTTNREYADLHAENVDFRATIDYLTRENAEQIGEIVALKEQRDELLEALRMNAQSLAWLANGKCRGFHPGLPTVDESLDAARSAIAKTTGEKS